MNGEELRKIVRQSGISISDIVKQSGIPEQTFYSLYKKAEIEIHFINKLQKTTLNNFLNEGEKIQNNFDENKLIDLILRLIDAHKELIEDNKQDILELKLKIDEMQQKIKTYDNRMSRLHDTENIGAIKSNKK